MFSCSRSLHTIHARASNRYLYKCTNKFQLNLINCCIHDIFRDTMSHHIAFDCIATHSISNVRLHMLQQIESLSSRVCLLVNIYYMAALCLSGYTLNRTNSAHDSINDHQICRSVLHWIDTPFDFIFKMLNPHMVIRTLASSSTRIHITSKLVCNQNKLINAQSL